MKATALTPGLSPAVNAVNASGISLHEASLHEALPLRVKSLNLGYGKNTDFKQILKDVNLDVKGGKTLVLLGPSGCGKTSLLRAVSGLQEPLSGKISVGEKILFDSANGISLKPERRQVGMVFQDLALFPHLSAGQNVAYGISKNKGRDKSVLVSEALALVDLKGYENRPISTLSGGQQQRIALARALAYQPRVLLLDEPFASLDEPTRVELREQIHKLLSRLQTTAVFVTHNQEEAFILGDEVAVMGPGGSIEQQDTPLNLYTKPANPWVADFVGNVNLIEGISDGTQAKTYMGLIPLQSPVPPAGTKLSVLIRPESLVFTDSKTAEFSAEITLKEYYGHDTLYLLAEPGYTDRIWIRSSAQPYEYERGTRVGVKYIGAAAVSFLAKQTS